MAASGTEQQVVTEIEKLKSVAHCKIIKNVGDFNYLIDVTVPESNVLVKFQLTGNYSCVMK